jgi:hypothetical protein
MVKGSPTNLKTVTAVILLLATLFLPGCTWSHTDLAATVKFFKENRTAFDSAVADARKGEHYETMRKRYRWLSRGEFDSSSSPLLLEFEPINFYYVIVFAEDKNALKQSHAMKDEGSVKRRLGGGWYVVQRGFM